MFSALFIIIILTILISIIARGYIPDFENGFKIKATGLLSVNSIPKNASVYINDKLYTTTDDTINLIPSDYQLKIIKDGYLPWSNKISIQKEMVYQAQATLFKTNPILSPLSLEKIINPTASPDLSQIIYVASSSSSSLKPGIYAIETNNYLSLVLNQFQSKFVTQNPFSPTDKTITFTYSPNSKQVILKSTTKKNTYLIDLTTGNVSQPNEKTYLDWELQAKQLNTIAINKLPKIFTSTIATNPATIYFSSDENKFLYLLNDKYYVYDLEKNINNLLGDKTKINSPFWLPKSNNILYLDSGKIKSIEFDGTNNNTIYSSDSIIKNIIPQYDGNKIIISSSNDIFGLTIK